MSPGAPDPVGSGRPYPVASVSGSRPTTLQQFVGVKSFTFTNEGGAETLVHGQGSENDTGVRFIEKNAEPPGRDVRAWQISAPEGIFSATAISAF